MTAGEPELAGAGGLGLPARRATAKDGSTTRKHLKRSVKILIFAFVINYLVIPQIAGARRAAEQLLDVQPALLAAGIVLQAASIVAYSVMTRACLPRGSVRLGTLLRIQLATKAVTNTVPGGGAAGNALGYRLLTLAGVEGSDAGFALGTAGIASAAVLNVLLWVGLLVSIPLAGFNPLYVTAAVIGVVLMLAFGVIVVGLMKGEEVAARALRGAAAKVKWVDEDAAERVVRHLAARLRELLSNPAMLRTVVFWAAANWVLDMASLWVFIRAFGASAPLLGLVVAYGLANVMGAIPVTPGGLGIIEGVMIPTLVGFGVPRDAALLGVPAWRLAQFWLPIPLGGLAYMSLRMGPWAVARTMPRGPVRAAEVSVELAPSLWDEPHWADSPAEPDTPSR